MYVDQFQKFQRDRLKKAKKSELTWVNEYLKGEGELVERIRVVK